MILAFQFVAFLLAVRADTDQEGFTLRYSPVLEPERGNLAFFHKHFSVCYPYKGNFAISPITYFPFTVPKLYNNIYANSLDNRE